MPNWHFLVVRHFGGANQRRQTCAQIKQQVERHGWSNILPLVKYELSRQNEYYLGLAVDTNASADGNDAEKAARHVLIDAGIRTAANRQASHLVEAEQVQGLLRGTLHCESFTIPISYEAGSEGESPTTDWILSELDVSELRPAAPIAAETEQYSRLLYWCTSIGSGGLGRIRQACQALCIGNEWGAWSVLRRLVLLGHLEFDGGATLRWSVIPPTIVTSIEDDDHRILVGQRTPGIVQYLSDCLQLEERPQPNGPPRLLIQGAANEICYRPGRRVQDAGCVSRQLSKLLPALEDWVLRLPTWDERDFGRFSAEEYDPQADVFRQVPTIAVNSRSRFYRFTYEHSVRPVVTIAFFDDCNGRWICGDYYGLRFIARARSGLCRAIYRRDTHQLVVPVTDRWPMPYERALVLASGALPQRLQADSGPFLLVYEGVPPEFAACLCNLLGLEMEGDLCST